MTAPTERDRETAESLTTAWETSGRGYGDLDERIAAALAAERARVAARVKAVPTYKVITEGESLGTVVLADDVLDALNGADRAARNATCCEHAAHDHDTHGCAINVSTHSRTYERCHGLVTADDRTGQR